jgi:hypothetical protein
VRTHTLLQRKSTRAPFGPIVMAFFAFVVIGSPLLQVLQKAFSPQVCSVWISHEECVALAPESRTLCRSRQQQHRAPSLSHFSSIHYPPPSFVAIHPRVSIHHSMTVTDAPLAIAASPLSSSVIYTPLTWGHRSASRDDAGQAAAGAQDRGDLQEQGVESALLSWQAPPLESVSNEDRRSRAPSRGAGGGWASPSAQCGREGRD